MTLTLSSAAFPNRGPMPATHAQAGENKSPPLRLAGCARRHEKLCSESLKITTRRWARSRTGSPMTSPVTVTVSWKASAPTRYGRAPMTWVTPATTAPSHPRAMAHIAITSGCLP